LTTDRGQIRRGFWTSWNASTSSPRSSRSACTCRPTAAPSSGERSPPCLFRAPQGATSPALIAEARRFGFTTVDWSVDPRDWSRPGANAIYDRVLSAVTPGAIVIQHDGGGDRSQTLAALPREIDTLRRRGYRFVTVTQLLGLRMIFG
jgi:peptidoglycan/xylan/chitin deacetylase (PgdA/CDA1 family)